MCCGWKNAFGIHSRANRRHFSSICQRKNGAFCTLQQNIVRKLSRMAEVQHNEQHAILHSSIARNAFELASCSHISLSLSLLLSPITGFDSIFHYK